MPQATLPESLDNRPSCHARASPLARKPYDFRHAGVSWRLNAGTPATLVAEWAGHTVEVLHRIYAHCLDGDDERWFTSMQQALSER
jgi:integrase